jgi:predicted phage terminase large subunit-like protein
MSKKRKKKNSLDGIMERILKDQRFRKAIVHKSFEYFFPIYMSKYMEYETPHFHEEMFDILKNDKIKLAVIVAFRGSAKSTLVSTAYVLWSVLAVQQKKFIVLCGQTEQKARQHLANIKEQLQNNELLKKDLGPFEEERNSLGNATAIIIKKLNVKIMICSTEQSIRGARHNQHRPDLIILDDIEDLDSVRTKEGRNKTFSWLTGDVIPAGTKKTRIIAVGNLLHEDSILRRLEKKIERGELKSMNPVFREYPIVDAKGVPLWPSKYPTPESIEAEHEKTMDEVAWQREYMLKIIATDEQIIRPEYIQFYKNPPADGFRAIYIAVDLAIGQKENNDCTAIVVGYIYGVGKKMKVYVRPHSLNKRLTFPETAEYIKALVAREKLMHNRVKVYVEDVGYQRSLVQYLDIEKYDIEAIPVNHNKATRLQLTTPLLKEGRVLFSEEGCEEIIEQLLGFGKEAHDDLPDAFSMLVMKAVEENPPGKLLLIA